MREAREEKAAKAEDRRPSVHGRGAAISLQPSLTAARPASAPVQIPYLFLRSHPGDARTPRRAVNALHSGG
jgi:hypothetical protein